MISILYVIAAFGGGVFAAAIGGVPAFILTGVFSILGSAAGMCGAGTVFRPPYRICRGGSRLRIRQEKRDSGKRSGYYNSAGRIK